MTELHKQVEEVEQNALARVHDVLDMLEQLHERTIGIKDATSALVNVREQGERIERALRCALDAWADGKAVASKHVPQNLMRQAVDSEHFARVMQARCGADVATRANS